jgi:hypothetical protein
LAGLALIIGLSTGLMHKAGTSPTIIPFAGGVERNIPDLVDPTNPPFVILSNASTTDKSIFDTPVMVMDTNVYKTKLGSLEATVKLLSPNITQGYASDDDLKADLTEAANSSCRQNDKVKYPHSFT